MIRMAASIGLLVCAVLSTSCTQGKARRAHLGPTPGATPTALPSDTPALPTNPSYSIGSGGTVSAIAPGAQLRATIRQVGRPIIQTASGAILLPGATGGRASR